MKLRGRLLVCVLSAVGFFGQLASSGQAGEESHLSEDVTSSSPAEGGDLLLDSITAFTPGSGQAIIEPGTPDEETVSYTGIGSDPTRLFGVTRTTPLDHPEGAVVRPATTSPAAGSPGPSASPTSELSAVAPSEVPDNGSDDAPEPPPETPERPDAPGEEPNGTNSPASNVVDELCDEYFQGCDPGAMVAHLRRQLCAVSALLCNIPPSIDILDVCSWIEYVFGSCQIPPDISDVCDPYCALPSAPAPTAFLQVGGRWIEIENGSVVQGGTVIGNDGTCVTQTPLVIGVDVGTGADGVDVEWSFDDYCRIVFEFVGGGEPPLPRVNDDTPIPGTHSGVGGEDALLSAFCLLNGPCGDPISYRAGVRLTMYEQYGKVATETIQRMTYKRSTYDNGAWEGRNDGGACTHSSFPGWHIKECTYHIDWQGPGVGMKRIGYYWNHAYTPIHYEATAKYWTYPGGYKYVCTADGQWPRSWHGECEGFQKMD